MRLIFSIILSFSLLLSTASVAEPTDGPKIPNAEIFIEAGKNQDPSTGINTEKLIETLDISLTEGLTGILVLLYNVGLVVAVCVFTFMGILVLIASPNRKAELKAGLYPYFIGLLLYIAGVPIAIFIINTIISLFKFN